MSQVNEITVAVVALAITIIVNLLAIGMAYGLIRGRLDALEKAEDEQIRALGKIEMYTKDEIKLVRDRVHELSNRMSTLILEIIKLNKANGAK